MWYVIQVLTGTENSICIQAKKKIPSSVLEKVFVLHREEKKKIRGEWTVLKKLLFPGYVFVITDHLDELRQYLKAIIGLTRLLGAGDDIIPLTDEEICLLQRLGGDTHTVKISEGIIENERVIVTSGSLKDMEGYIRKIDRHKRKAWIEVEMFGRKQLVQMGLEIVSKR